MEDKIEKELLHFDAKGIKYGASWWGNTTYAGKRRLKRRAEIVYEMIHGTASSILEIGCGAGEFTRYLKFEGIHVVSADISKGLIDIAKKELKDVKFVLSNAEDLPFGNEVFDAVVGSGILHHVNLENILNEMHRVLKPNKPIIFFEPNMLNPQIFLERNIALIRKIHQTEEETAFIRWKIERILKGSKWNGVSVKSFDFLHPAIPKSITGIADKVGKFLEKMPLVNEFAGSVVIYAMK